jgi:flagellar basal-body rod protein FlgB
LLGQLNFDCAFYEKALDAASLRQKVLSENLANINTPGYQTKDVAFEDTMKQVVAQEGFLNPHSKAKGVTAQVSDPRHIKFGHFDMASFKMPVNYQTGKLDINQEMVKSVQNQMIYQQMSSKIGGLLSSVSYVIDTVK